MQRAIILLAGLLCIAGAAAEVSFVREVAPIFQDQCVGCHREGKAKGKYRMDSYAGLMKAVEPGDLDSELHYRISTDDTEERMPSDADPLPAGQLAIIRKWIEEGAKYDAADPNAALKSLLPVAPHPAAPTRYPRAIPVTAMVFSPAGDELFTGGYHEILVWDAEQGKLLRRIPDNGQRSYDLAVSPDGQLLASATGAPGSAGEVRIFNARTGEVIATPLRLDDVALCVAFDPSGTRLACGGCDGKLRVYAVGSWEKQLEIAVHSDWMNALAWNEDGTRLATASRDKTAKVFDLSEGAKRVITFSGHTGPVRGVAFHPDGRQAISCADDGLLVRWNIGDGKKSGDIARLQGHALRLLATDSGYFAIGSHGPAALFAREDQKRLREFKTDDNSLELARHGKRLAIGTFDGRVVLFDAESGERNGAFSAFPK